MTHILFVCTANVSRSFLAEQLFRREIERIGLDGVTVASAGAFAGPSGGPDPRMVEYLEAAGIPVEAHTPRQIEPEDLDRADRILVMEKVHARFIAELNPAHAGKVEMLGQYVSADGGEDDIVDPYGLSSFHYRTAIAQITMAVRNFAQTLSGGM